MTRLIERRRKRRKKDIAWRGTVYNLVCLVLGMFFLISSFLGFDVPGLLGIEDPLGLQKIVSLTVGNLVFCGIVFVGLIGYIISALFGAEGEFRKLRNENASLRSEIQTLKNEIRDLHWRN
ncbi:MAG: hypothetical protein OXT69_08750 [Candidatus Poribacteria bacterium]|nr:hypothetical protein [Candidatus Poribacteria bacterium]